MSDLWHFEAVFGHSGAPWWQFGTCMQTWDFFGTKFGLWSHLGPSPKFGISLKRLDMVEELPARVGSKELAAHAWKNLLADHSQPRLQCVIHLNLALLGKNLETSSFVGSQPILCVPM